MNFYAEEFLSSYLCGYWKGLIIQQALVSLIEKWKTSVDKKSY